MFDPQLRLKPRLFFESILVSMMASAASCKNEHLTDPLAPPPPLRAQQGESRRMDEQGLMIGTASAQTPTMQDKTADVKTQGDVQMKDASVIEEITTRAIKSATAKAAPKPSRSPASSSMSR